MKLGELTSSFVGIHHQFVVISSWSYVIPLWAPLQPADLLGMGLVSIDQPWSQIPRGYSSISRTTCQQSISPIQTSNPSIMPLETCYSFFLGDIEHLDLSIAVPNCYPILIAEGNRTDIIIDLTGLIKSGDFRGAARPKVEWGIQSDCDLVVIGPG